MRFENRVKDVRELQGLYGPVQILEARIQQVWGLQEFRQGTWFGDGGERIKVLHAGYLNRGAGPDFREARIEIDGTVRVGDVEVHLYREDWWRHHHNTDNRYENVMLHAVLFSGGAGRPVQTASGRLIPEWVMGPWLRLDLETLASGEAGLWGESAPELSEWISGALPGDLLYQLRCASHRRWEMKVSVVGGLRRAHGRNDALHRLVLYYLGYPLNRAPFWEMAETFSAEFWDERLLPVLKARWGEQVQWTVGRPAARAEKRLLAYARFPDGWMESLGRIGSIVSQAHCSDKGFARFNDEKLLPESGPLRQELGLTKLVKWIREEVLRRAVGEEMTQRLLADVFLPMAAACGDLDAELAELAWFHGRPGHHPPAYGRLLREARLVGGSRQPLCNGLIQGLYRVDDDLRLERLRGDQLI